MNKTAIEIQIFELKQYINTVLVEINSKLEGIQESLGIDKSISSKKYQKLQEQVDIPKIETAQDIRRIMDKMNKPMENIP